MFVAKIVLVQKCLIILLCVNRLDAYYNREKKYEIKKNYVDIYTNHPYTNDVLDSYRNTDFYKVPTNKYTIHRSDNYDRNFPYRDTNFPYGDRNFPERDKFPSRDINSRNRNFAYRDRNEDRYEYPPSKFKETKDVLYSDFGIFEPETEVKFNKRRNDTKNNYNFVFDDEKNLVYLQPIEDDIETDVINKLNNKNDVIDVDDDKKFVYLESQKHVIPNVGIRLAKRPNFQTVNGNAEDVEEPFNYRYPKPTRIEKNLIDNKSKFNEILRRYVTKLNGGSSQSVEYTTQQNFPSANSNELTINDVEEQIPEIDKSKFLEVPLNKLKTKTINFAKNLFSLFTIIQFPNSRCLANSSVSGSYEGTCYHATECAKLNGTAMGFCAKGFGVCCVFRGTCGGNSDRNCTYFESPNYPNYYPTDPSVLPPNFSTTPTPIPGLTPDPRINKYDTSYVDHHRYKRQTVPQTLSCIFRVYKSNPNIQQMRIDFIDFELNGPINGTCTDERLIISGFNVNTVPILCGYNTGQHVYVDVSGLIGPLQLQVISNTVQRKRFKIRICQYGNSCTGSMGCLQYYTGISGVISSFNYDKAAIYSRSDPSYYNNLNYAICIRREPGYCSVTYTNVNNGVVYPFELVNFINGIMTVPLGEAGVEIFNCPNDYIVLNGLRLCGYRLNDGSTTTNFSLNAPVTDTSGGPIVIPVRSNGMNVGRGFRLFYMQNRCPT